MSLYFEPDPADKDTPPQLPPLLTPVSVEDGMDVMAKAVVVAAKGHAGQVLYSQQTETLDMAVTMIPEVTKTKAMQMHYVLMVALGDAIGALAPPEIQVQYRFPGFILLNQGYAGFCRVEFSTSQDENGYPSWLIGQITLELSGIAKETESGHIPDHTSLEEEGGGYISRTRLLEAVSRHFLVWLNRWEDEGFKPIYDMWNTRLDQTMPLRDISIEWLGIDGEGFGLIKQEGKPISLAPNDASLWEGLK